MTTEEFLRWMEGQYNRELVLRSKMPPPEPEMSERLAGARPAREISNNQAVNAVAPFAAWAILGGVGVALLITVGPSVLNGIGMGVTFGVGLCIVFPILGLIALIGFFVILIGWAGGSYDRSVIREELERHDRNQR